MKSMAQKNSEDMLKDYQKQADEILRKMYQIVVRAQRKVEDQSYSKILSKVKGI